MIYLDFKLDYSTNQFINIQEVVEKLEEFISKNNQVNYRADILSYNEYEKLKSKYKKKDGIIITLNHNIRFIENELKSIEDENENLILGEYDIKMTHIHGYVLIHSVH